MGLQEVKDEILNEAEEKASRIKEDGEEQSDEIIESAEREAEQIREEVKREIEQEKQALRKKEISKAQMDAKKRIQESRQKTVESVFKAFEEELEGLSDSELEKFVENARDMADFEVNNVVGSKEFEDVVETDFEVMDEQGLILESENEEKSLNLSFDRIVDDFRKRHRGNIAKILIGDAEE